MSTRSLSFVSIPFSSFLTLVYNLIVACPDFASVQTSIPNPSILPSNLYFIGLLGYSSRSLLYSETLNGFSQLPVQSSHFLPWPSGTSLERAAQNYLLVRVFAHTAATVQHSCHSSLILRSAGPTGLPGGRQATAVMCKILCMFGYLHWVGRVPSFFCFSKQSKTQTVKCLKYPGWGFLGWANLKHLELKVKDYVLNPSPQFLKSRCRLFKIDIKFTLIVGAQ